MADTTYDIGFRARLAGEDRNANPHPAGSFEHGCWDSGWEDQDHHLNNRDEALRIIGLR